MQHSVRKFENEHSFTSTSEVIECSEQQVKIVTDGKPTTINAIGIVFAETIFHPQGGGQPSDKGTINGFPVLAVREDKFQLNLNGSPKIFHFMDPAIVNIHQFQIGQKVEMNVDEAYRFRCMRSHSTGHLLADVLEFNPKFQQYQPKATHGNHFPDGEYIKAILASQPENMESFCDDLNSGLDDLIQQNLSVSISSDDNKVRHIKIGNSPRMCGGTHLKSSSNAAGSKVTKARCSKNKEGQIEATIFYSC